MTVMFSEIGDYARTEMGAEVHMPGPDFSLSGLSSTANWRAGRLAFAKVVDNEILACAVGIVDAALIVAHDAGTVACPHLRVANPRLAFAQIAEAFFADRPAPGIHPTAIVDPTAEIDPSASVGPYCVVGARCRIGARTVLHTHVTLHRDVIIGTDCVLWSHCVLGEDGYGIERRPGELQKRLPHFGGVVVGNGVQIGNFSAIVGGTLDPTRIGDGTMIDNLVHVAHNVQAGKNCQIIACAEVSGSVVIGDNVTIAPNATVIQKIEIGENSLLGIGAVATKSIPANVVAAGVPAKAIRTLASAGGAAE